MESDDGKLYYLNSGLSSLLVKLLSSIMEVINFSEQTLYITHCRLISFHSNTNFTSLDLTDDIEYEDALAEASRFQMPRQFRYMFATICAYCHPSDPLAIWNNFKEFMIEDLLINHNSDVATNIALTEINSILYENDTNCERIGLPIPLDDDSQLNDGPTQEQQHEIDFNILNNERRHLVDSAILAVEISVEEDPTHPKCLYVDAPGGSGKTFVLQIICVKIDIKYHVLLGLV